MHKPMQRVISIPRGNGERERIQVLINVADGTELEHIDAAHCDGIGLVRTELLLRNMDDLRDEESNTRRTVASFAGRMASR
jgi:phosphotransferase system enzyme I (PtsI)